MLAGEELPSVGEIIGGYRLDRLIATGGMGAVFAATHERLRRRAAVKVLDRQFAADQQHVSRFFHEARIANDIRHPNIVEIYDFVESGDHIALVMELLEGPTLSSALASVNRFSIVQTINVTLQMIDAIDAVHRAGVVHRDLKPPNILMIQPLDSEFWDAPSFKILDFGIAKQQSASVQHRTVQGAMLGTPAYMAPEQVAGEPVSSATDLYAVGEIMFEMAAGRRLFDSENILVLTQKLKNELPRFDIPKEVPNGARIAAIVRRCVAPVPEDRPNAEYLRRALAELLEDSADLDGTEAATILAMEAVKAPQKDAPMNTQMFFDRILDDIAEINRPEAPPPPVPAEPLPELKLASDPPSRSGTGDLLRVPSRAGPPVIVGTPVMRPGSTQRPPDRSLSRSAAQAVRRSEPRRFLWLLMAPALILIVTVAVPGAKEWARSTIERLLGVTPNPVRRHLAAWKEVRGEITGTAADHLEAALAAHLEDSWPKYEEAEAELQRALILEPENVAAIAFFAENRIAWKRLLLAGEEAEETIRFLEYARSIDPAHVALERADARRAEVLADAKRCRELSRSVREERPADPLAALIEGECTIDEDAAMAEALIRRSADRTKEPGRAIRLGARARAGTGRYAEALRALDRRLVGDPKNGPALLEAAAIDHAVGEHERELLRLRSATRAEGDQLYAQLMLGRVQAELHKVSSARSTLLSLAENDGAPAGYRREAYAVLARLAVESDTPAEAFELLSSASALGSDLMVERVRAEALLAARKPAEVIALAGERSATEEQLPLIALLGGAHVQSGRPDEAKHAFEGAVAVRPEDPRLIAYLAGSRTLLDDFSAARRALDEMLRLDPLEVIEDDRAPVFSDLVARAFLKRLAKMRDVSTDRACVDAVMAALHFYANERDAAMRAAKRSVESRNPPRIALIIEAQLAIDSDPDRADTLGERIAKDAPSAAGQLLLARLDAPRSRERAADAYGKALSINPELPLARIERTALELRRQKKETVEELYALHVAYSNIRKLRRLLFEATE